MDVVTLYKSWVHCVKGQALHTSNSSNPPFNTADNIQKQTSPPSGNHCGSAKNCSSGPLHSGHSANPHVQVKWRMQNKTKTLRPKNKRMTLHTLYGILTCLYLTRQRETLLFKAAVSLFFWGEERRGGDHRQWMWIKCGEKKRKELFLSYSLDLKLSGVIGRNWQVMHSSLSDYLSLSHTQNIHVLIFQNFRETISHRNSSPTCSNVNKPFFFKSPIPHFINCQSVHHVFFFNGNIDGVWYRQRKSVISSMRHLLKGGHLF